MRNTKRGSWYIQELNTTLRLHARDMHLADIMVQVGISVLHLHILHAQCRICLLFGKLLRHHCFLLSISRSTGKLRSVRVMLLAPPTIAAKRCRSSPARCAKTSTFSPSTSPSIDMQICAKTIQHTHRTIPHSETSQ